MHMHITKTGKNNISGRIQRRKRGTGDGSTDAFRELGHQGRSKTFGLDHRSHKCLLSYSLAAIRLKKCPAEGGKTVVAASRCIYLLDYTTGSIRLSSDNLVQIPLIFYAREKPVRSRTTSPASSSPAAPGTKATLPGICRLPRAAASSSQPVGVRVSSRE